MDPRLKWTSDVLVGHTVVVEVRPGCRLNGACSFARTPRAWTRSVAGGWGAWLGLGPSRLARPLPGHAQRKDGSECRGILSSLEDGEGGLALKLSMVTQTRGSAGVELDPRRPEPGMELKWGDVACITAQNIGLSADSLSRPTRTAGPGGAGFDTDAAIGAGRGGCVLESGARVACGAGRSGV